MSARDEILTHIRTAISGRPATAPTATAPPDESAIPRDYRTATADDLSTFLDRLAHYEAATYQVAEADLDQKVREVLTGNGRRIVVPDEIPSTWTAGLEPLTDDPPLTHEELDAADGVITTCALAIAQTGTIVLDGGPGMGRRALTLVPDYHLCVVHESQIVPSIPEAIVRLEHPTRPITFISGPSATVDIEMVRVRGVHGPRRLEVIIARSGNLTPRPA